jgi:hypothetical protein
VLARLLIWDAKNHPPLADMRILQTKVESAQRGGYAFGCNSILSDVLAGACIGKQNCEFLKKDIQEKKKEGLIVESSFYENDQFIYEEVAKITRGYEVEGAEFIRFEKSTGVVSRVKEISTPTRTIWPVISEEIGYETVSLPTDIESYESTVQLVEEIKTHIKNYADLPENFLEFTAWYVLMSWVYNRPLWYICVSWVIMGPGRVGH